ncbi:TlpA family protein disulfide reductase, partial [Streptomyces sp. SID10692]|nr:TlpA family protein disulfide reductase [Streptomyces sp. SID10692]NEA13909.1 TlpA family protein disulfide reductase [Streptomyces sp. SID10692]
MTRTTLRRGAVAVLCAALLPVVPAATAAASPRPP